MSLILLIEDEPALRANLATALRMEGYDVIQAADGNTGTGLARARRPDVVVCDVMMPEMGGYDVLAAIRSDVALLDTPFIFLTGMGDTRQIRQGMNHGADDYLVKPVALAELIAAIDARLRRNIQRRVASGAVP
ncbi:MAG: response regulator [Verrucomicrobiaceae bacterium]|nr:response regulator [Verrucomicrobiaceae bacterium]